MSEPHSDVLVFFGASGDLAFKMIFPALQALVRSGRFRGPVIGVAKAGWTVDDLRARAKASLQAAGSFDPEAFAQLGTRLSYLDGDYQDPSTFDRLKQLLGTARHPLHYLAIPPSLFAQVVSQLARSGCAEGSRVVVEKPFGRDLKSAKALNATLRRVFPEEAIFRIDHYLGKEAVQNLVVLRFANAWLEPLWNHQHLASIQINMAEKFGVDDRGALYDSMGAVRDVVQNHLLMVLALLTMSPPSSAHHTALREGIAEILTQVEPLRPEEVVRGQFEGYTSVKGVAAASPMETFVALKLAINHPRWRGVPVLIRAGKCLPVSATEVLVTLKGAPMPQLGGVANSLRLRLSPRFGVDLQLQVKRPGEAMVSEPTRLALVAHRPQVEMTAYERLLGDAVAGDLTLFAGERAVEAAWRIVDPILVPEPADAAPPFHLPRLEHYPQGTWGPPSAERLAAELGGWDRPGASA